MFLRKLSLILIFIILTQSLFAQKIILTEEIIHKESPCEEIVKNYYIDGKKTLIKLSNDHRTISIEEKIKGELATSWTDTLLESINDFAIGDINKDNIIELLALSNHTIYVFEKDYIGFKKCKEKTVNIQKLDEIKPIILKEGIYSIKLDEQIGISVEIGDVDNDFQNEVLCSRRVARSEGGFICAVYLLKWKDDHFEVVDYSLVATSGDHLIKIIDLNNDGENEVLIGRYDCILVYCYDPLKRIFGRKAWIEFSTNVGDQKLTFGKIDNQNVVIQVPLFTTSGENDNVGKLRVYNLESTVLDELEKMQIHSNLDEWTIEEFIAIEQLSKNIKAFAEYNKLPVINKNSRSYSPIEKLSLLDYDLDGDDEILCQLKDKCLVLKLTK